jgi:hypothetical protein
MTARTDCGHRRAGDKRVSAGGWDRITGKNSRIGHSIKTSGTEQPRYVSLYRSAWRTERTGRPRSDIKDRTAATGVLQTRVQSSTAGKRQPGEECQDRTTSDRKPVLSP